MTINTILISLLVIFLIYRLLFNIYAVIKEGMISHTDHLEIMAETLFYVYALLFVGFWRDVTIPGVIVAGLLASTLWADAKLIHKGKSLDWKNVFIDADAPIEMKRFAKKVIITFMIILQIGFFFLLWLGGLFSKG